MVVGTMSVVVDATSPTMCEHVAPRINNPIGAHILETDTMTVAFCSSGNQ
jgi:hypothetical protein